MTVREWIEHLTGLRKSTAYDYRSYLKNDIAEPLGDLPLAALSPYQPTRFMSAQLKPGSDTPTASCGLSQYRDVAFSM